ncbi:hypothetical protein AAP_05994 [Ascosphaera apis ARSEF 7405]|uniref:Uncharacterized protein n=1 Tax=Ascosphaera apis ARSEF 7405 TaxID=392613 RepID=A0A167V4W1_9EURO|nr:hypothetical protein AAP_05994 [Ascosphaera apis ARSEF 7405]
MAPEPSTPSNRKLYNEAGTPKTVKRMPKETGVDDGLVPSPTKKVKPPGSPVKRAPKALPTSLAQATEEERMMFAMRGAEKPWAEIQKKWEEMTGERVLITSIRARYHKIKHNLQEWSDEDEARLLRLEVEVEEQLKSEKWNRLAEAMIAEGSPRYSAAALQKKLTELKRRKSEAV